MTSDLLARFDSIKFVMPATSQSPGSCKKSVALSDAAYHDVCVWQTPVRVDPQEAAADITALRSAWDRQVTDSLLEEFCASSLRAVVGPFGLGKVLTAWDKLGGNVTTSNNAEQKLYAKEEQRYNRTDYCGGKYPEEAGKYRDSKTSANFTAQDEYTGKAVYYRESQTDHIVSCGEYHRKGGFIQTQDQKRAFAEDANNFGVTTAGMNSSMSDLDKLEWAKKINAQDSGKTNAEYYDIDIERLQSLYRRGRESAAKHGPNSRDWAVYYGREVTITGVREAGKVGVTQAVGLVLVEFIEGISFELKDSYAAGFVSGTEEQGFLKALLVRLKRVARKVLARWKDVLQAFKVGALSGFLANALTVFSNTFITTVKRVVRIIREGALSFVQAGKLLLFRPEGMSFADAAGAAVKLIAGAGVTCAGILLEEALEKSLLPHIATIPLLGSIAPQIIAALTACLTGAVATLVVYGLDRLDLFGVNESKRHAHVVDTLEERTRHHDAQIEHLLHDFSVTEVLPKIRTGMIATPERNEGPHEQTKNSFSRL